MKLLRIPLLGLAAGLVLAAAGCGGGSTTMSTPDDPAGGRLQDRRTSSPSGPVVAGKPVKVSFTIQQPDGTPLVHFKTGPGPHTGVHLILVRDDLAYLIHEHPPVGKRPTISKVVTFPAPGPYRLVVDVYPATASQQNVNFQLFGKVNVKGNYVPKPLPPTATLEVVDGYRFTLHGAANLKAIQAQLVTVDVTGPGGEKPTFTPWFGALAHAIFFRKGSLDYFHTHVCAPGRERLHERARADEGHRHLGHAREAQGRRARPGARHLAAVPPVPDRRKGPHRPVHAPCPLTAE